MKYLKVWTDFKDVLQTLEFDEIGRLFVAMLDYAGTGEEPSDFAGNERFLWAVAKRDIDKMEEKAEALRQNGSKGGLARSKTKQNEANDSNEKQTEANDSNEQQTEANSSLKEKKIKEKKGNENKTPTEYVSKHPPTIDDVREYCRERGNKVDPERFVDFYASKGWKVGNQPMKDWRAAVRTWERSDNNKPAVKKVTAQQYEQRSYDNVEDEAMRRMMELPDSEDEMDAYFSKGAI